MLNGNTASQITSSSLTFTAYIQYTDYSGFAAAMEALRGKKLVHIPPNKNKDDVASMFLANIGVSSTYTKQETAGF